MSNIPAGHSLVTHVLSIPAPGGNKAMTCTYGVANFPDAVLAEYLHETFHTLVFDPLGTDKGGLIETVVRDEITASNFINVLPGTRDLAMPPPNTSLLVRKGTGLIGRPFRGRMYPPGLVYESTYSDGGVMSGGDRDDYQEAFDGWLNELQTGMATNMVLLHSAELAPTVVTSLTVDATASTQRRRLR